MKMEKGRCQHDKGFAVPRDARFFFLSVSGKQKEGQDGEMKKVLLSSSSSSSGDELFASDLEGETPMFLKNW